MGFLGSGRSKHQRASSRSSENNALYVPAFAQASLVRPRYQARKTCPKIWACAVRSSPAAQLSQTRGIALFAGSFSRALVACWATCKLINSRRGGTARERNEECIVSAHEAFRGMLLRCPWIRLHGVKELEDRMIEACSGEELPYVLANHNSKLDSLAITGMVPGQVGRRLRSLIKVALLDEPFFGYICRSVGHYPVHFLNKLPGNFKVDKEKQAEETKRMDAFIASGGSILIFPEGSVNTGDSRKLQSFRRGSFALPMKYKKRIVAILNVGCENAWPVGYSMGGVPGNIHFKVIDICDDASTFQDVANLAEHAQAVMQRELDLLYEVADSEKLASVVS